MSKRARSEKGKQPEPSSNPFVSQNSSHRFSVIQNKHAISSRNIVLADFEHLDLANILNTSSLEYLVSIKEPVYPELVHYFYSNLTFQNNHVRSRVLSKDINISLDHLPICYASPVRVYIFIILISMILNILTVNLPLLPLFYFTMMTTPL